MIDAHAPTPLRPVTRSFQLRRRPRPSNGPSSGFSTRAFLQTLFPLLKVAEWRRYPSQSCLRQKKMSNKKLNFRRKKNNAKSKICCFVKNKSGCLRPYPRMQRRKNTDPSTSSGLPNSVVLDSVRWFGSGNQWNSKVLPPSSFRPFKRGGQNLWFEPSHVTKRHGPLKFSGAPSARIHFDNKCFWERGRSTEYDRSGVFFRLRRAIAGNLINMSRAEGAPQKK